MLKTLSYSKSKGIIVYLCMKGEARFSDIENYLDLNPSMVDRRLKQLVDDGLVDRDGDMYKITSKGRDAAITYNLYNQDKCEEYCNPDTCVGPLLQAESIVDDYADSITHDILEVLPATADEIETKVDMGDESVHNHILGYERWNFVEVEDGVVQPTEKAEKARRILDAL